MTSRTGTKVGKKRPRSQAFNAPKIEDETSTNESSYSSYPRDPPLNRRCCYYSILLLLCVSFLLPDHACQAAVPCTITDECETLLRPGSECIDNVCTNPFQKGCLRNYLGENEFPDFRTCNSEDSLFSSKDDKSPANKQPNTCTPSPLDYSEVRILSQNWESAMFTAWILQIVLSELVQVPATIESSGPGRQLNFYDPGLSFSYGAMGYDFDALQRGNALGGGTCPPEWRRREGGTNSNKNDYQSCAHVMPEVWSGQASTVAKLAAEQILEPPEGTGVVGKLGWFIPKYLAKQDPSMAHWLGMTGELNRRKVAETFRVPTTFGMFCSEIVPHNCTEPTLYASRPPADEAEAEKYFVGGGVFNGYFRFTDDNDCDLNPDTCVGHITDVPCEWTTFVTAQSYHLHIPVKSQGSVGPNHAYSYGQLLDIWAAANATKSAILLYWWYPDPTYQYYLGSDAEMQAVQLPPPQQSCITHRVTPAQRCSENITEQVGIAAGACDAEPHSLVKLVVANLYHYIQGRRPKETPNVNQSAQVEPIEFETKRQNPALVSPAYDLIQAFSITELQLGEIADAWEKRGLDKWSYDPHEAVCEWVVDNLDTIKTWIPRTYPRIVQEEAYNHGMEPLYGVAVTFGIIVSIIVMVTTRLTYKWRERPLLVYSQVNFLFFLLGGLELVAIGSLLVALEPKDVTCTLQNWFVLLGYTLELVPLIVKVGAIHRMTRAAKRMKRITLDQRHLYMTVVFFGILVSIALSIWTAIDPSVRHSDIVLHRNRQTSRGETIVTITHFCTSNHYDEVWRYFSLCWQMVLLLCATVLAYQTRNIRKDLNESHTLGVMVYSHFVFLVFRVITFVLAGEDENGESVLSRNVLEGIRSLLLSMDVLVATSIYFGPKMYGLMKYDDDHFKAMMAMQRRQSVQNSSAQRSSFQLGSQVSFSGLDPQASGWQQSSFSAHMTLGSIVENEHGNSSGIQSGIESFDTGTMKRRLSSRISQASVGSASCLSAASPSEVVGDIGLAILNHDDLRESNQDVSELGAPVDEAIDENDIGPNEEDEKGPGETGHNGASKRIERSRSIDASQKCADNGTSSSATSENAYNDMERPEGKYSENRKSQRKSDRKSLSAPTSLNDEIAALGPEASAKATARMSRSHKESPMTEEMFLDYVCVSNESNMTGSGSISRKEADPESAPDGARQCVISVDKVSESGTSKLRLAPIVGIRKRSASLEELRFEKLCSDDRKLDENHYFF